MRWKHVRLLILRLPLDSLFESVLIVSRTEGFIRRVR